VNIGFVHPYGLQNCVLFEQDVTEKWQKLGFCPTFLWGIEENYKKLNVFRS